MTCKEQNKILDAKIEPNVNQYKVDRINTEISAFSSGDLNKYEFLKGTDLNYKPNALYKARFEFSPLGKTFSAGLDKTAQGYQEEGVIKLLKDIRDSLRGGAQDLIIMMIMMMMMMMIIIIRRRTIIIIIILIIIIIIIIIVIIMMMMMMMLMIDQIVTICLI